LSCPLDENPGDAIVFVLIVYDKQRPAAVVCAIAEFLGRQLSDEEMTCIVERIRFEKMKNYPLFKYVCEGMSKETPYMRKGIYRVRQKYALSLFCSFVSNRWEFQSSISPTFSSYSHLGDM